MNDAAADAAFAIGSAGEDPNSILASGSPGYILAHAALGCASSAALGTGCAGGAIGGATSAVLNPLIDSSGNIPTAAEVAIAALAGGVASGLAGANPQAGLTAAENETLNNWAAHIGLSISVTVPHTPWTYSGGVGLVVDGNGNFGWYTVSNQNSVVPGVGVGGAGSIGVSVGEYPAATTINNYAGVFNNTSIGAGLGEYGSVDVFQDPSKSPLNPASYGGGVTWGFGVGGSGSVIRTNTTVHPFGIVNGQ